MSGLRQALDRGLAIALPALLGAAVLNVSWQVFSRYVLGAPGSGTDELARLLLVWIGLLGAAAAVGRGAHLAVDLWPARWAGRAAWLADASVLLFSVTVLVGGGGRLVWLAVALGQRTPALGLPMGLVYAVVPMAGFAMAGYALSSLAAAGARR